MDELLYHKHQAEGGSDSGIEDPAILSEEGDIVPHTLIRAGDFSPKHRHLSWDARFPRTIYETEQFGGFAQHPRLHSRRKSDPGRLSLSPNRSMRGGGKIRHGLSDLCLEEDREYQSDHRLNHPRLAEIRERLGPMDDSYLSHGSAYSRSLSPSRSRPRERGGPSLASLHRRTQRSFSLPSSDGTVIEINEAIGALAVSRRLPESLAVHSLLAVPTATVPGRRRSISMEPGVLESIAEEGLNRADINKQQANRRFSASHLD